MNVLLITYDLNKETKRPPIVAEINKIGKSRVRLSESSYAVATSKSTETVYKDLKRILDEDDVLYVITLKEPCDGRGPEETIDWLDEHLSS